ncbi:BQ5605_C019g08836 [Microbotryum silenes-dioicae]|uniref:BQ5605_C019g08836 protein n=1 Tax=Microbotryum silenes-dioicae TaxID=796604 RepID=A0A2X0LZV3_9BASI|nr:BQ5605_C019g08836 [Microbotryum silenes-dioicae]
MTNPEDPVGKEHRDREGMLVTVTNSDEVQRIERHEIALEPHWFRVQTERIKRCNSQAKKDY